MILTPIFELNITLSVAHLHLQFITNYSNNFYYLNHKNFIVRHFLFTTFFLLQIKKLNFFK